MKVLRRLLTADDGQDLVEYALLGATVAFAGLLAMNTLGNAMNNVYTSWDDAQQGLWEPQDPAS